MKDGEGGRAVRDREFEGIYGMSVFLIQWPSETGVEIFDGGVGLLGDVTKDRMHHLAFVVPFLALDNVLG